MVYDISMRLMNSRNYEVALENVAIETMWLDQYLSNKKLEKWLRDISSIEDIYSVPRQKKVIVENPMDFLTVLVFFLLNK